MTSLAMMEPVAVLFGGHSAEREVSCNSGRAVLKALRQLDLTALAIDTAAPLTSWIQLDVGCAFIALHGAGGEDGSIQGVLELAQIPYTGSGILTSALCMDKWRCRQLLKDAGFKVPKTLRLLPGEDASACTKLGELLFVKPNAQGSSVGCNRVGGNFRSLEDALSEAFGYGDEVLVEPWLEGPEYHVAMLDDRALTPIRIEPCGDFYDYSAKYRNTDTRYHLPSGLSPEREEQLKQLATRIWREVSGSGWGRIDFIDEGGDFLVLEINTSPGMTERSLVPMAAEHEGMGFADLVQRILQLALDKKGSENKSGNSS